MEIFCLQKDKFRKALCSFFRCHYKYRLSQIYLIKAIIAFHHNKACIEIFILKLEFYSTWGILFFGM